MKAQADFTPHVTILGQGPRRMLALHCTMAFGGAWAGFAKHLGDQVTLVAPDLPSHGQSVDWDGISEFSETCYLAALSAMDDEPMDVIGHSFGGVVALRLAVAYPEKVRSLTMFEPVFLAVAATRAPEKLEAHSAALKPALDALLDGDRETAARVFNGMWSDEGPKWETLPTRTREAMVRAIHVLPGQHRFLFTDTANMLAPGALDCTAVPTLIMRGEFAHPALAATNDVLAEIMPNAEQSAIDGAGHMGPISHPAMVAQAVAGLLARS